MCRSGRGKTLKWLSKRCNTEETSPAQLVEHCTNNPAPKTCGWNPNQGNLSQSRQLDFCVFSSYNDDDDDENRK
jgi:hypothetical protein